ncbi:MAG TPA: hypothetical protein VFK16_07520 [Gemmatimonadaceae bacterium]|jgi:hypothetical protein|nr:hypothetical protein [Gemmatimonadaceae bacterium]
MPAYNIATAAFATQSPRKWVDNITAHHDLPGVSRTGRGAERSFSFDAVVALQITRTLCRELQVSAWRAVELATALQASAEHAVTLPGGLLVSVDLAQTARDVQRRLLEAAESVPRTKRGRPAAASPLGHR